MCVCVCVCYIGICILLGTVNDILLILIQSSIFQNEQ